MYGNRYGYRSGLNASMVRHLKSKVEAILSKVALSPGDLVLDIGSNDGTLLQAYPRGKAELVGIDPSGEQFRKYYPEGIGLIPDFFSAKALKDRFGARKAKVITSIAMFYDLDAPADFVAEMAGALAEDGVLVCEQSYLPTMIEQNAYDTVCHEHLEYYALRQVKWMTDRAQLKIVDFALNAVNGGSFSFMAAKKSSPYPECTKALEAAQRAEAVYSTLAPYAAFRENAQRHREALLSFFKTARSEGKTILGYGASTKGNVILQYCGLTEKDLPRIGEVNSDKFGAFTPGTHIPIVPECAVRAERPDYLLVLPWHFKDFIVEKEAAYRQGGGKLFFPLPKPEICG
jgi:NDP-4-keto-2,6-dideoxyhexose 3-C-methyltransferase